MAFVTVSVRKGAPYVTTNTGDELASQNAVSVTLDGNNIVAMTDNATLGTNIEYQDPSMPVPYSLIVNEDRGDLETSLNA